MVKITAPTSGGTITDTARRDQITLSDEADTVVLNYDGRTDRIFNFDPDADRIDFSKFNVSWGALQIKHVKENIFTVTIYGEKTKITVKQPETGDPIGIDYLSEDNFIFATGSPPAKKNVIIDSNGKSLLFGTDQIDTFIMNPDYTRDVIKRFDPLRDKIDLSGFGLSYDELKFVDVKKGKVVIKLGTEGLVVRDLSKSMTSEDFTQDLFIFI